MRISDLQTIHLIYRLPDGQKWEWSGGYFDSWSSVFVQVIADDGTTGLGEVYQGSSVGLAVPAFVEHFKSLLIGENPLDIEFIWHKLYNLSAFWNRQGFPIGILGAIDIALYDMAGKVANLPVYQLLGGCAHSKFPMYYSAGCTQSLEQILAEAEEALSAGFKAYKWRVLSPAQAGLIMKELRNSAGSDFDIMVDAVQGSAPVPWAKSQVYEIAEAIEPHRPAWFEEPFRVEDPESHAELRRRVSYPIAGGESVTSVAEAERFLSPKALDILQPDLTVCGGFTPAKRMAALAELRHVAITQHCWGGAVSLMANLHFGLSQPTVTYVEYPRYPNPLREELLHEALEIKGGCVTLPRRPGLGVELREDVVHKFRATTREGAGLVFEMR